MLKLDDVHLAVYYKLHPFINNFEIFHNKNVKEMKDNMIYIVHTHSSIWKQYPIIKLITIFARK